jgi:hypothetical protein
MLMRMWKSGPCVHSSWEGKTTQTLWKKVSMNSCTPGMKSYVSIKIYLWIIHNSPNWKQYKCPSTSAKSNTLQIVHVIKYYSTRKKSDLFVYTQHRSIFGELCEWKRQCKKFTNYVIPLTRYFGNEKITDLDNRQVGANDRTDWSWRGGRVARKSQDEWCLRWWKMFSIFITPMVYILMRMCVIVL